MPKDYHTSELLAISSILETSQSTVESFIKAARHKTGVSGFCPTGTVLCLMSQRQVAKLLRPYGLQTRAGKLWLFCEAVAEGHISIHPHEARD